MPTLLEHITRQWDEDIIPQLVDFISVPAKSPHFDPDWEKNGYIEKVAQQALAWVQKQPLKGLKVELIHLPGRTPVLFFEVPASEGVNNPNTVLFYGHLDKQPEMVGWRDDLGPWKPVVEGEKLYGRGGADDGYAVYAAIASLVALEQAGKPHARCVGLIETCEESGSYDLPAYIEQLAPRMGQVDFVVALDSGCGDYERMWVTTSLRGMVCGTLRVDVLEEGVHSGDASGVVPSSFRVARQLINRLENVDTGEILPKDFHCDIPAERQTQAKETAVILGQGIIKKYPFVEGMSAATSDPAEALLNRTWRPALSVTGADGLPSVAQAGNVLRPQTTLKLSLRLPPLLNGDQASVAMKAMLEKDPPYHAKVSFTPDQAATGWNAAPTAPWLAEVLSSSSTAYYGQPSAALGEGGSIPFMGMLGKQYPNAQFLITGVLGPKSNAHGPNEFLHLGYVKKLNACVAEIVTAHATA